MPEAKRTPNPAFYISIFQSIYPSSTTFPLYSTLDAQRLGPILSNLFLFYRLYSTRIDINKTLPALHQNGQANAFETFVRRLQKRPRS